MKTVKMFQVQLDEFRDDDGRHVRQMVQQIDVYPTKREAADGTMVMLAPDHRITLGRELGEFIESDREKLATSAGTHMSEDGEDTDHRTYVSIVPVTVHLP